MRIEKEARLSRQRPVSCHFCRSRKLRCSRQFPCPNCTSRGLSCQLYASSPLQINNPRGGGNQSEVGNEDILARVRRLEDIVIGQSKPRTAEKALQTEYPLQPSLHSRGQRPYIPRQEQPSTADANWLEKAITYPTSARFLLGHEIEFKTCSIQQAMKLNSVKYTSTTRCIWLPLKEESEKVVDKYLSDITYLHHVVHRPSVRALVNELYYELHQNKPIKLGQTSLLLAILASTTSFWTVRDMDGSPFSSVEQAHEQSMSWAEAAFEALEYSRRMGCESIEDIQAMLILLFVVCNLVGIQAHARHLLSTAISVARELCLHRIDHQHNSEFVNALPPDSVRAEIGRRVWWYLVSTDWQVSQFAGSQKGTYSINPRQMMTNKPRNANDEDLIDGMVVDQPIDQPTSMSYCLHRIRLGELCREITDNVPFAASSTGGPAFQQVQEIDIKFRAFANELPAFFSLDIDLSQLPVNDLRRSPEIIAFTFPISIFHRPHEFLLKDCVPRRSPHGDPCRGTNETREISLRADSIKVFRCLALSTRPTEDQERRGEIFDAFGILEEAKGDSPFAKHLLDSFMTILRRNKVSLPEMENTIPGPLGVETCESASTPTGRSDMPMGSSSVDLNTDTVLMDSSLPLFGEFWQTFDTSIDANTFNWDNLFSELDSSLLSA
ncbi:hypothetical protein N7510_007367 [Penicillium lagena]|uniref:uncharacterized protein n=1 Tax=Penicillium lagena TaxID=94218 RepID=UPI00254151FA|nr:uncharacterized protein N7510_007367 [Penicillium lagena]KAJ5610648.1 hypothetical protein N7510_007367 [Penicillium lagena]